MKELLLIAVGSALVNNVVLSQFLGICPFLGVSKNVKTAAGMGGADFFVCNGADLPVYFSAAAFRISADDCVYPCYCGTGAVCRNVSEKSNAAAVSGAGSLPASDYNQLCGTRSCTDKCAEIL
mgnify:CR=1 FL=1